MCLGPLTPLAALLRGGGPISKEASTTDATLEVVGPEEDFLPLFIP